MTTVLDAGIRSIMTARLNQLSGSEAPGWGVMSCGQMVCHIADQLRLACGQLTAANTSNIITRLFVKRLVLLGIPAPKGKVKTAPELDQAAGNGSVPGDFKNDCVSVELLLQAFNAMPETDRWPHPVFGLMQKKEWGRLVAVHLDHHLTQFGV